MFKKLSMIFILIILLLHFFATPIHGQYLDPDVKWDKDQWEHMLAGAVTDILVRGPYINKSWRDTATKRLALVLALSIIYEAYQAKRDEEIGWLGSPGGGFGLLDIAANLAGAASLEILFHIFGLDKRKANLIIGFKLN